MDWCKVVDSFARFIADQFILLCQGVDQRIINNIRGRQYTLAPRVQFQITEFPCETGKQFTLQDADDSSFHNCTTFRITRVSALLHIHQSTTSLKGPTDVWKHESSQSCSAEKLQVLAVMWNQLDILPPTQALLLAKYTPTWQRQSPPPAGDSAPQCKLPEERDKAQDVSLASKSPPLDPNLIEVPWDVPEHVRSIKAPPVIGLGSVWPVEILTKDLWRCCVVSATWGLASSPVGSEDFHGSGLQCMNVCVKGWMVTLSNRIEESNINTFPFTCAGTSHGCSLGFSSGGRQVNPARCQRLLHSLSLSRAVFEELVLVMQWFKWVLARPLANGKPLT